MRVAEGPQPGCRQIRFVDYTFAMSIVSAYLGALRVSALSLTASAHAPQRQQRNVVFQLRAAAMRLNASEERLRKLPQPAGVAHAPPRFLRQRKKSQMRQLTPRRRTRLRCSVRKRQNHV